MTESSRKIGPIIIRVIVSNMHILILNWRDIKHPLAGGAEISIYEHAKVWIKKGAHITWFSSSFLGAKKEEKLEGIQVIRKGSHYTVHVWALIYYLKNRFSKPDVVIDCFHFLPYFSPLYMRNTKIVGFIHEIAGKVWFENITMPIALIGYLMESFFFLFYKQSPFITVSESSKKELIHIGIKKANIFVIHNGVSAIHISKIKKENTPVLVMLGRLSSDKGIEDSLNAFKNVQNQFPLVRLWFIGREEKKGIFKRMIRTVGLNTIQEKSLKVWGRVNEKKKFALLSKAWILLHPSKREGWGLNVIEANTVGTPAIGYNIPGLRDSIKHKKTGILTRSNSSDLSKAICNLIRNETLREEISKNAAIWSKKFDWEKSGNLSWLILNQVYEK